MNQGALIERIKKKAEQDRKKRRDRRFVETMGLLVAKGFLRTNIEIMPLPNLRLDVQDAIWAGREVEPRILEVLPAAVLRLGKHFHLNPEKDQDLIRVVDQLKKGQDQGEPFCGIPFAKLKIWTDLPLRDGRVKRFRDKKILKTFRLDPSAIERLKSAAESSRSTETEILESLILNHLK